ncbi:MAG: Hsp33 family molecular chaperone HslO [Pseudomonadota bacterium]|nr:Hsp33 family molecular chaperone HslO [Pseudomonadota bacterium]
MTDIRQRFFIDASPVRGEVVHLQQSLDTILAQRAYPPAIAALLGEMLVGAALLASTLKIRGRLSIQAQGQADLKWAMAECSHDGEIRALAQWDELSDRLQTAHSSVDAMQALGEGVLFINIEPEEGERYQGIIGRESDVLAECLTNYFDQSVQIPTRIVLSCEQQQAGGLLIQLLPRRDEDEQAHVDEDLWPRLTMLTETLTAAELVELSASDILYRLYHEEDVVLPEAEPLKFGCTCSRERCESALQQVGATQVQQILEESGEIAMDCQFCNTQYRFNAAEALGIFGLHVN